MAVLSQAPVSGSSPETGVDGFKSQCFRQAQKRVGAILASHQTHPCHPIIDEPGILAGAEMPITINPAGKDIIVNRAAPPLKPSEQAGTSVWEQFELDRPTRFLLHHNCPRADLPAADNVANLYLHQVTAPELAVDRQVEQCPIS